MGVGGGIRNTSDLYVNCSGPFGVFFSISPITEIPLDGTCPVFAMKLSAQLRALSPNSQSGETEAPWMSQ